MNYLFHLVLTEQTPDGWVGAMMGDFVKGRLEGRFPAAIESGIKNHRWLDRFAASNPHFRRSRRVIDERFGHCRGILVDMFWDHLLARSWENRFEEPLEAFADRVYRALAASDALLPPRLGEIVPHMVERNWLVSYRERATLERALNRMSRRLSFPNLLGEGASEFDRHEEVINESFQGFLSEATDAFCVRRAGISGN